MTKEPPKTKDGSVTRRARRAVRKDQPVPGRPKNVKSAAAGLIENALAPATRDFGTEFSAAGQTLGHTAAGLVDIATAPFRAVIWGYRQVENKLIPIIIDKINKIPENNRVLPDKNIVGLALEGSKFSLDDSNLSEMFANLISSASDIRTKGFVHPAFVSIIQGLSADDAKIIDHLGKKYVIGFGDNPSNFPVMNFYIRNPDRLRMTYLRHISELVISHADLGAHGTARCLENLERLGLVRLQYGTPLAGWRADRAQLLRKDPYLEILNFEKIKFYANKITEEGNVFEAEPGFGSFSRFGQEFISSVIREA